MDNKKASLYYSKISFLWSIEEHSNLDMVGLYCRLLYPACLSMVKKVVPRARAGKKSGEACLQEKYFTVSAKMLSFYVLGIQTRLIKKIGQK